ncbi:M23 family metallopeptidase [uncultured Xylophilus sp.]|uniref:M23 family metallopeptidase n=1 Tax=uncultured Xylophilus sp. TaxID=296832 RepID=UPI0025DD55A7|nr:M23 family metallopeptidase [uncultured Xylophilus sp.]
MNHALSATVQAILARVALSIQQHPKRLAAAVGTVLLCGGGGAFAVANLAPDPSDMPVRQILQSVEPVAAALSDDTDQPILRLYRHETVRSSDSADSLLKRLGIADPAAAAFLRNDPRVRQAVWGRAGRVVSAEATDGHALLRLTARWSADDAEQFQRLVVEKTPTGFVSSVQAAPTTVSSRLASGSIQSSLLAATDDANIPESVANQIAEIFSSQIDFRRSLRKGDRFSVVYETIEADGEMLRAGRVLSAEFVNDGKSMQAMWYQPAGQKGGYFTLEGKGLNTAYLSSPVEFSRVSSGFSNRFHPVLQQWRMHLGTDFAAPQGTPVRTVGDGVVEFAGVQNGYGNVVFVRHRDSHTTVYAHLSKINVARGQKVEQGQNVGLVGRTGWATGPHLHFEFRVNGVQQDPMVMARQSESAQLSAAARPAFDRLAASTRIQLQTANQSVLASAD